MGDLNTTTIDAAKIPNYLDYDRQNVQIHFVLTNHVFCTTQIIWAAQINLGCTK